MLSDVSLLRGEGLKVVRSHHERWDGWGYPDRLARDEIPIGARVFAVADTLDAFTNDRPYRSAGSWEDASRLIVSEACGQFDPAGDQQVFNALPLDHCVADRTRDYKPVKCNSYYSRGPTQPATLVSTCTVNDSLSPG